MSTIKLQGNDDKEPFDVDVEVACCSQLLKGMVNSLGHTAEEKDDVVPVPNVRDAILRKVMEWAKHHKDDPEPTQDDKSKHSIDISTWDDDYIKVDVETLFELMMAANYLEIGGLLDLTCKAVAIMMKGKSPDEIRKTFNIKNDFNSAEMKRVLMENEWCEET